MAKPIWRLLLSPAAGGAENMALDEALMSRARETGEFTLRVYPGRRPPCPLAAISRRDGSMISTESAREASASSVDRPAGVPSSTIARSPTA
jgi:hypothetical protein